MYFFWLLVSIFAIIAISVALSFAITGRYPLKHPDSPKDHGLDFEEIEFTTRDRIKIRGWWIPCESSKKTIIFLHGYQGSMDPDLQYAPAFHQHGYNVLMFDFRGHGRSGGKFTSIGALERADASAAIDYAVSRGTFHIGLLGFSMGGRVAIFLSGEDERISAAISDCAPARLITAISAGLQIKGLPRFLARTLAFLAVAGASLRFSVNLFEYEPLYRSDLLRGKPFLFIQGAKDLFITPAELEEMVNHAGEQAELWLALDAAHRNLSDLYPEAYMKRVLEFFGRHLSKQD